jgi:hypothetical protein
MARAEVADLGIQATAITTQAATVPLVVVAVVAVAITKTHGAAMPMTTGTPTLTMLRGVRSLPPILTSLCGTTAEVVTVAFLAVAVVAVATMAMAALAVLVAVVAVAVATTAAANMGTVDTAVPGSC